MKYNQFDIIDKLNPIVNGVLKYRRIIIKIKNKMTYSKKKKATRHANCVSLITEERAREIVGYRDWETVTSEVMNVSSC